MRRRQFISLIGGAAATWPLRISAQQRDEMPRIGFISPGRGDSPRVLKWGADFEGTLGNLGWIIGRNLQIDYRWGAIGPEQRKRYAREPRPESRSAELEGPPSLSRVDRPCI